MTHTTLRAWAVDERQMIGREMARLARRRRREGVEYTDEHGRLLSWPIEVVRQIATYGRVWEQTR
jgi:hypothetical protein